VWSAQVRIARFVLHIGRESLFLHADGKRPAWKLTYSQTM
jgi:hypothetical protein